MAFLDDRLAVGMTVCRGYVASYEASGERLDFRATSMTEYGSSCPEELRQHEGQFTDDLSQAIEYSVSEEEGDKAAHNPHEPRQDRDVRTGVNWD